MFPRPLIPGVYWYKNPDSSNALLKNWIPLVVMEHGGSLAVAIPGRAGLVSLKELQGQWGSEIVYTRL